MRFIAIVLLFFNSSTTLTFANDSAESRGEYRRLKPIDHHHHASVRLEGFTEAPDTTSTDTIAAELVDSIHEIHHNHGQKTAIKERVKEWVHQFRLIQSGRDLRRWVDYQTHHKPAWRDHAANLGVLFAASHLIEVISGPALATIGYAHEWPEALNMFILGVGGVISIPGLDPVCIILAGSYKSSPGFRLTLTQLRGSVTRLSAKGWKALNIQPLIEKFIQWEDPHSRIARTTQKFDGYYSLRLSNGALNFKSDGSRAWLDQVTIENQELFQEEWSMKKKLFDGNIRSAIEEILRATTANRSEQNSHFDLPFYIDWVKNSENSPMTTVKLKSATIQARGQLRKSCERPLTSTPEP